MMLDDCPFCRILNGELETELVYRDETVAAFFHISPVNPGHMLVIPVEHHGSVTSIPENVQGHMLNLAGKLGSYLTRILDMDGYNLHMASGDCAGQAFRHAHIHVIPRGPTEGFAWSWRCIDDSDVDYAELTGKLRRKLGAQPDERQD